MAETKTETRTRKRDLMRYEARPVGDPDAKAVIWLRVQAGTIGAQLYAQRQGRALVGLEDAMAGAYFSARATGALEALGVPSKAPGDRAAEKAIERLATDWEVEFVGLWDDLTPMTEEEMAEWQLRRNAIAEAVARRVRAEVADPRTAADPT